MDAIDQFRQAMTNAGLTPPDTIHDDGKLHRYSTDGKPSHKNGWYFLHLDGIPWGQAGSWDVNGGEPVCHWCAKSDTAMTQAERDTQRQRSAAMKAQQDADKAAEQKSAATTAAQRLASAAICTRHPYLAAKGVQGYGVKIEGDGFLIVPMRDTAGTDHSAKVKDIIEKELGVEREKLTEGASFIEDLGADSLDIVELVMEFEKEFNIDIPDEDAEKLRTVGDAIGYLNGKIGG